MHCAFSFCPCEKRIWLLTAAITMIPDYDYFDLCCKLNHYRSVTVSRCSLEILSMGVGRGVGLVYALTCYYIQHLIIKSIIYVRRGKESVVLRIAVCKRALKSTKVKLRNTMQNIPRTSGMHGLNCTSRDDTWLALYNYHHGAQFKPHALSMPVVNMPDVCGMFCVVLRNLTLVLFKAHLHTAIRSTTLSFPLLIYACYYYAAPQYQYRVSLYSPLTTIDNVCRALFSVSLDHKVFIKASILSVLN